MRNNKVQIIFEITEEKRWLLKKIALKNKTTVSNMMREYTDTLIKIDKHVK